MFVFRISHFFFLSDQKWERFFLVALSFICLEKKIKIKITSTTIRRVVLTSVNYIKRLRPNIHILFF
jgi:hypothetical protein